MTNCQSNHCPHDETGWCLACVGRLRAERDRLREDFEYVLRVARRLGIAVVVDLAESALLED